MEHLTQAEAEKRPYHSRLRQHQAEETRRRILLVARELFESRGFAATTLEAIAEQALVSPKTVTAVFGSKLALLAEIINPEAFSAPARQIIEELRATEDPSRRLSLVAQITRQAFEPLASSLELLRTAGAIAPELAGVARQIETRRRQNQARLIAALREQGALRPGLSQEEATDALWALTSYDLYRMLVVEQRWKPERYEAWLAELLIERLLALAWKGGPPAEEASEPGVPLH
ncbi:MAG TPA: helix-turn-helix domain-containing protein [Ktedonobacteraceae bacterium]|nr:helix-turn-helix domain-containing protein [Ktedonobacteraceae bacterium]